MDVYDFLNKVEDIVSEHVKENYPLSWDEDHITYSIAKELRDSFRTTVIDWEQEVLRLRWNAYKLTRPVEHRFGDLALIIKILYQDGDTIEGVAFLEAKKRGRNSSRYGAFRKRQSERINNCAPHSIHLLYDYEEITRFAVNNPWFDRIPACWWPAWRFWRPYSFCAVVPTNLLLQARRKDRSLYKLSLPFSYQLCFRYLRGYDLEFKDMHLNIAKGFLTRLGAPEYLLTVVVTPMETKEEIDIKINPQCFTSLE